MKIRPSLLFFTEKLNPIVAVAPLPPPPPEILTVGTVVYPEPPFATAIDATPPLGVSETVKAAPEPPPPPEIVTVGAEEYPEPSFVTIIAIIENEAVAAALSPDGDEAILMVGGEV